MARTTVTVLMALGLSGVLTTAQNAPLPIVVRDGFQAPEAALYDSQADVYLVSNINGEPGVEDDNGFISRVAPDGTIVALRWIAGADKTITLHAPKGMAFRNDLLLVADIDFIRLFDRNTGAPRGEWPVPNTTFLNDVAVAEDGTVWATDTGLSMKGGTPAPAGTAAVYRFGPKGEPSVVARGSELEGPNGIIATVEGPVFVTFFGREISLLDPKAKDGKPTMVAMLPLGQLDGLLRLPDGNFLVSSWEAKGVYRTAGTGPAKLIVDGLTSPANLGYDRKRQRVLIPLLMQNELHIVALK